ncbi:CASP-like protein [Drosera capensis]
MESKLKTELLLRLSAALILVLAAILIRTNSETKLIYGLYENTAKSKDLRAFMISEYVFLAAASYSFLQTIRRFSSSAKGFTEPKSTVSVNFLPWLSLVLDQVTAYLVFASNIAAAAGAAMAITGSDNLQWIKLCNIYTRFCYQAGGHIGCGAAASLLLAIVAGLSAFNVFSFYSPKHFLALKRLLK